MASPKPISFKSVTKAYGSHVAIQNMDLTVETGEILYANLILQGKEYPLYFFKSKNSSDHYDENGQSIKKTLTHS